MPAMEERRIKKSRVGGRRVERLWEPRVLDAVALVQSAWDIFSKTPSFRTMVPCIQPLMGGMVVAQAAKTADNASFAVMSQAGVSIWTPWLRSSSRRANAASTRGPDLESNMRFLAPLEAIQRAELRPRPPRPPAIT